MIFINAMAKTHESFPAAFVLRHCNELRAVVAGSVYLPKHFNDRLVRAAMERTPKRAHAGSRAGKQIRLA